MLDSFGIIVNIKRLVFGWFKLKNIWGCGAAGSVLEWHSRGRGFDPRQLHFDMKGVNSKGLTPFLVDCMGVVSWVWTL